MQVLIGNLVVLKALAHGAVSGGDRQRAYVLVANAAAVGRHQKPRHALRGDTFVSRQAGPIDHHQLRELELALGKPALDGLGCMQSRGGRRIGGRRQRQKKLPSHQIVRHLVDVAHCLVERH